MGCELAVAEEEVHRSRLISGVRGHMGGDIATAFNEWMRTRSGRRGISLAFDEPSAKSQGRKYHNGIQRVECELAVAEDGGYFWLSMSGVRIRKGAMTAAFDEQSTKSNERYDSGIRWAECEVAGEEV